MAQAVAVAPAMAKTQVRAAPQKGPQRVQAPEKDIHLMFGAAEAQWILTVLDDASNKLALTSYLTPDILKDRIMDAIDHETVIALKEHFEVEKQYALVLQEHQQRIEENGGVDVPMDEESFAIFQERDLCLSDSTRTVARLLKGNSVLARRLRDVCAKRDPTCLEFINIFARLRKLVHDKLRMTAEEERTMKEQLEKLKEEDEDYTRKFLALTEGLAVERADHKQTLAAKDQKIARLRKQIDGLTIKTEQERESFELKMKQEADLAESIFKASEDDLLTQHSAITKNLSEVGQTNYADEMKEHRKKFFRAQEVEELIQKYDVEMNEKHSSLTELKDVYKEESAELRVLQEYFDEVDAEMKRQKEELAALKQRRDAELIDLRTKHQAAVLVQRLFRGFHTKALSGAKKSKAASKKGDKKKK